MTAKRGYTILAIFVLAVVAGAGPHLLGYEYAGCQTSHPRIREHELVRAHVNIHRVHGAPDLCIERHGATHCYCPIVSMHRCTRQPWTDVVKDAVGGFR